MSLRTWSFGRLALAWAYYWLLLAAVITVVMRVIVRADFAGLAVDVSVSVPVLLGPPIALTVAWLWVRRRR